MTSITASVPLEIWRVIFRFATATPEELFSDYDENVVQLSHHLAVQVAVNSAYTTKCSLSSTCRLFHSVADEFLFEVIIVRRAARLQSLASILLEPRRNAPARGWWCRLLYIHLDEVKLHGVWDYGRRSLWGLIEACPNVVDLRCSLVQRRPSVFANQVMFQIFLIPAQLLQLIARAYGPTLKRLELLGAVRSHIRDIRRMLSTCPSLEVCRLTGVDDRDSQLETYDRISDLLSRYPVIPASDTVATGWSPSSSDVVSLPNLHSLALLHHDESFSRLYSGFTPDIQDWILPSLRKVHILQHWISYGRYRAIEHLVAGLTIHAPRIKYFSYMGSHNILPLWPIIDLLPAVESVEVSADVWYSVPVLPRTHQFLSDLIINVYGLRMPQRDILNALSDVLRVVRTERLPELQRVEVENALVNKNDDDVLSLVRDFDLLLVTLGFERKTVPQAAGAFDSV